MIVLLRRIKKCAFLSVGSIDIIEPKVTNINSNT